MAQGKYSRVDGKKSSWSATTVVVVVGVCLVGVWMLTSSSIAPGQNPELPAQDSKTLSREKVSMNPSSQFEDNSGDLPEDAMKDGVNQETAQGRRDSDTDEKTSSEEEPSKTEAEDTNGKSNDEELTSSNEEDIEKNTEDKSSSSEREVNSSSDSDEAEKSKSEDENSSPGGTDSDSDTNETKKPDSKVEKSKPDEVKDESQSEEKDDKEEKKPEDKKAEAFPAAFQSEILNETRTENGGFSTQATESASEKESQKQDVSKNQDGYKWKTCNVTTGPDYIPCLDNIGALRKLHSTLHYEHRERHCPAESPTCLVPLPQGYKTPIRWPRSREQV